VYVRSPAENPDHRRSSQPARAEGSARRLGLATGSPRMSLDHAELVRLHREEKSALRRQLTVNLD